MAPIRSGGATGAAAESAASGAATESRAAQSIAEAAEQARRRLPGAPSGHPAPRRPSAHLTVDQRQQRGRVARAASPRSALAAWEAPADRSDPVALLTSQEASRVQDLIPVRHARMSASAFAFYRGSALLMAADLASGPRSGLDVQLCGDAHLSNFGLFAAPDRTLVFDLNDFDETNPGPFEWDVKRLATSFVLAARDNGLPAGAAAAAAGTAVSAYRTAIKNYAQRSELDVWYDRIDVTKVLDVMQSSVVRTAKDRAEAAAAVRRAASKARQRTAWSAIAKLTEVVDGRRQFRDQPPLLVRIATDDDFQSMLESLFHQYRSTLQEDRQELLKRYQIIDIGHKVVGVGSVGLLAMVLLLQGRDEDDLMVLQVKQAQASVLEAFTRKSAYAKHGHRVVSGQRLMQAASDSFLGWIEAPGGRSFYVRQLRDMKWSPDPAMLTGKRLQVYAELCGSTMARAHARSGDAIALASYMGSGKPFDKAVTAFALSYADQAERDFAEFTAAIASGRLGANEDVAAPPAMNAVQELAAPGEPMATGAVAG